jgi:hypothetical protein
MYSHHGIIKLSKTLNAWVLVRFQQHQSLVMDQGPWLQAFSTVLEGYPHDLTQFCGNGIDIYSKSHVYNS